MYKRILVAVDGSENSKRAANHAAYLASFNANAAVEVLHVLEYEKGRTGAALNRSEGTQIREPEQSHTEDDKRLSSIKGIFEEKKINYELVTKQGEPGQTIVSFANRGGFDIVVIGNRGLNSFQEMVLGSVSHKVAKRSQVPVLIVK